MTRYLDIYRTQLKTTIVWQLQYRAALVIWLIEMVLQPLIYLIVWSTVARASGGKLGGFTGGDFAAYYVAMMVVNHLTFSWVMYVFEYRIRQGDFSFALLRPLHPIHSDIADNVGYKLLTLLIMAPAVILLSLAFGADFHPSLWAALGFLPALALAFLVRFLLEWAFAMAAFWTTRVDALNQVYYVASLFFSGLIAPLSLLPAPLRTISALLPFRWLLAFPVDMALGRLTQREALIGYAAQLAWLAVTVTLLRLLWPAGVRRYAAVGQ